jgi:hypothetical protein
MLARGPDAFGSRTLGPLPFGELDSLPFMQLFERDAFERRAVEEEVSARLGRDESKPLVSQSLDTTFSHLIYSSRRKALDCPTSVNQLGNS